MRDTGSESGERGGVGKGKGDGSRRTQFKKGERHGKARKPGEEECQVTSGLGPSTTTPEAVGGGSTLYEAMLWVANDRPPLTPLHRRLRKLMNDPKTGWQFMNRLAELEKALTSSKPSPLSSDSPAPSSMNSTDAAQGRVVPLLTQERWEQVKAALKLVRGES